MFKVHMPDSVDAPLLKVLHSGYISEGNAVDEFENKLGEYFNNKLVCTVNNCTSALTMSLLCADVKPGDFVLSSPMTCMASNMPIHTIGANIVWVDIERDTGNICPKSLSERIAELASKNIKPKAVLYVHWAGQPANISAINAIAKAHNIQVIEDCAHAMGAEYNSKKIGNHGDFCCFSFQAIKHITTGDGGCVTFNGPNAENNMLRFRKMRWYGLDRKFRRSLTKWHTDIDDVGFKMHMNDIAATIGLSQIPHIETIVAKHRANALFFDTALSNLSNIEILRREPNSLTAAWIYTLKLESDRARERFCEFLTAKGIACNVVHVRNDKYTIFKPYMRSLPGVDDFCSRMVNIPCGWWLTEHDLNYIADTIRLFK